MITRARAITKKLLGLQPPGLNLAVLPDDTFLVAYPKSGNTWVRFLIANLCYSNPSWSTIDRLVPSPDVMTRKFFDQMPRPRIIWGGHDSFTPKFKRVIYIVRDPRDVAISQYHHHRKRKLIQDGHPFDEFLARFLAGMTNDHGSWKQNVASWLGARQGEANFLLLRYEDLLESPESELLRIARFLGVAATDQKIREAVERSSPERMRKLEQEGSENCALTKDTRRDLPFVRSAKSGNWRKEMSAESVEKIERAWAPLMNQLGYELSTQVCNPASAADVPAAPALRSPTPVA